MNIKDFIRNLPIQTLVEIGCWTGNDTLEFRNIHPNARIVGFEPDPRNVEELKRKTIDKMIELYPLALSNTNSECKFYLSEGLTCKHTCSSSLKQPTGHLTWHPSVVFPTSTMVQTIRLDDFEPLKNTKIDFIWADVQGAEDLVFSGAAETLKRTHYVYTEYCNTQLYDRQLNLQEILTLFGPDWRVVHDFGGDVLLENIGF
jgi:FkbM family methyltransferase